MNWNNSIDTFIGIHLEEKFGSNVNVFIGNCVSRPRTWQTNLPCKTGLIIIDVFSLNYLDDWNLNELIFNHGSFVFVLECEKHSVQISRQSCRNFGHWSKRLKVNWILNVHVCRMADFQSKDWTPAYWTLDPNKRKLPFEILISDKRNR